MKESKNKKLIGKIQISKIEREDNNYLFLKFLETKRKTNMKRNISNKAK